MSRTVRAGQQFVTELEPARWIARWAPAADKRRKFKPTRWGFPLDPAATVGVR